MPVDTQWFFEVFLEGFIVIWTYRYFSGVKEKYAEFEWLALSAFWGVFVISLIQLLPQTPDMVRLFTNPIATGFALSFYGAIVGFAGSRLRLMSWFQWILCFLGKEGKKDKSISLGEIFKKK